MSIPKEVFLSHSSADHRFAMRLAETLRRHGVPIWYSPTDILGAQQWQEEIGAALERCDWFAVVLSPDAVGSMWVKRELQYALHEERLINRIVPLLYQPCLVKPLSWVLPSYQHVDFQKGFETGCRDLLRTWSLGYQPEP